MLGLLLTLLAFYYYLNSSKRYISFFLIMVLSTSGFQMIPVSAMEFPAIGITKTFDWVFILCSLIFLFQPLVFLSFPLWQKYKHILVFLSALIILFFYSILYIGVEVSVAVRVLRNYCFFFSLFIFITGIKDDFIKAIKLIIYATSIASFLYCLQPLFGVPILNSIGGQESHFSEEGSLIRFFNLPVLVLPVVFFFFFPKGLYNIKFYPLLAFINIFAIILSQHRSMLLALIFAFLLDLLVSNKVKLLNLLFYVFLAASLLFFADAVLGGRFTNGFRDLSDASISISDVKNIRTFELPTLSTSEFRAYHFIDRLLYVLEDWKRSIMGIGLITEDSKIVYNLNFTVGTTSEDLSSVPQVATADIVWSVLILHLGLFGIAAFLIFYYGFLKQFLSLKRDNLMKIGIYYIAFLFFTSVYGIIVIYPHTFCMVMLLAGYGYKLQLKNEMNFKTT